MKRLAFAACAALAGCTSTTPASDFVKVASAEQEVAGCKFLKDVRGDHNLYGGNLVQIAIDDATAQIKNRAAQAGGNVVLITSSMSGMLGSNMKGKAYHC